MSKITKAIAFTIIMTTAQSLEPRRESQHDVMKKIIDLLSNKPSSVRRAGNLGTNSHDVLQNLTNGHPVQRTFDNTEINEKGEYKVDPQDKLKEEELTHALTNKKAAIYDHPYLERTQALDFLVINPGLHDPSVTVIPNSIYINVEKKCVNWLDDCSLKGIRARLLRGVQSPYR